MQTNNYCTKLKQMKTNALSVANYFIELSKRDNKPIHLLGLVKRVYIAHGFSLALQEKGLINPRFDRVEAWKYGPVIPSVYHSFKRYRASAIIEPIANLVVTEDGRYDWETPTVQDANDKKIVDMVWRRYLDFTDSELVTLTHREGTPWQLCYIENENVPIPDEITAMYYLALIENVKKAHGRLA